MYTLKISKGFIDETESEAKVEFLDAYEALDEACEAAERLAKAILRYLIDPFEVRTSGASISLDDFYITYGDIDGESEPGYIRYYRVQVIEK